MPQEARNERSCVPRRVSECTQEVIATGFIFRSLSLQTQPLIPGSLSRLRVASLHRDI